MTALMWASRNGHMQVPTSSPANRARVHPQCLQLQTFDICHVTRCLSVSKYSSAWAPMSKPKVNDPNRDKPPQSSLTNLTRAFSHPSLYLPPDSESRSAVKWAKLKGHSDIAKVSAAAFAFSLQIQFKFSDGRRLKQHHGMRRHQTRQARQNRHPG